jgi:hypothetical protein
MGVEMSFVQATLFTVGQIALSFYGFWLVWLVLLPILPGPGGPENRIAKYAYFFTDPLAQAIAKGLHVPLWLVHSLLLLLVAAAKVGIERLSAAL